MLLASDMDGTVIPLDSSPSRAEEIKALKYFVKSHQTIKLAYVTGRDFDLALQGIEQYDLPYPNFIVGDVGSSIYEYTANQWEISQLYRNTLGNLWGNLSASDILNCLCSIDSLTPQEPNHQSEFKASYYCPVEVLDHGLIKVIETQLAEFGLQASIITSIDSIKNCGLIDILPPNVSKEYALRFLQNYLSLSSEKVVFAGDSGNDLAAFLSGYQAIVVSNTPQSVKETVKSIAEQNGYLDKIFFASEPFAAGVLEGLEYFSNKNANIS